MDQTKGNENKRILALLMVVFTTFVSASMGSALNLSIPAMGEDFGTSAATVGWVITIYTLIVAAFSVPIGKVADNWDRYLVQLIGIIGFMASTLACGFAGGIGVMIAARLVQGIFGSFFMSTNIPILISIYPPQKRGLMLGISTASVYTGLSVGPVIGGIVNHHLGWRFIFYGTFILMFIPLVLSLLSQPKKRDHWRMERFDLAGNLLYIVSISLFLYGLTTLTTSSYGWVVLAAGILFVGLFAFAEHRAADPVIRVEMFTEDMVFTFSNLAALLNYGATFAISYLISIYLQVVMGFTSQTAGFILICMPAVQAIFSPSMGRLSDKIAPYKLASSGMGLCVLGLILFSRITTTTPLAFIVAALCVEGLGFALFSSPNTNAVMSCVEKKDYAVANSILATMRSVGHTSSMAIVTIIIGLNLGTKALTDVTPPELVSTMHLIFIIFIVLCVIGIFLSLARRKTGEK